MSVFLRKTDNPRFPFEIQRNDFSIASLWLLYSEIGRAIKEYEEQCGQKTGENV